MAAAFLRLFKQLPGSFSEVQLRGLSQSCFSTFLFPLLFSFLAGQPCGHQQVGGAALLLARLLSRAGSPCLSGPNLFPTTTWTDLAAGSPQLRRDLAAAGRPHPVPHTGLLPALQKQKKKNHTKFLGKKLCSRRATLLLELRCPQLQSPPSASVLCWQRGHHPRHGRHGRATHRLGHNLPFPESSPVSRAVQITPQNCPDHLQLTSR